MGYKWYSYFLFILKDNILNLFVIYGIYHTIKKYNKERILLLLLFFLPLIYFIQLACRQNYYIILFPSSKNDHQLINFNILKHNLYFIYIMTYDITIAFMTNYTLDIPNIDKQLNTIKSFYDVFQIHTTIKTYIFCDEKPLSKIEGTIELYNKNKYDDYKIPGSEYETNLKNIKMIQE